MTSFPKNVINEQKLKLLKSYGNIDFFEYSPTMFSLLYTNFEPLRFVRRFRLSWEYLRKDSYKVYYLAVNKVLVGYCLVARGGRRLNISTRDDIVIGPYFIDESYRGKGFSKVLIKQSLELCGYLYKYAFSYIKKSNLSSIRASLSCGFEKVGELDKVGLLHTLKQTKNGEYEIYRYLDDLENRSILETLVNKVACSI